MLALKKTTKYLLIPALLVVCLFVTAPAQTGGVKGKVRTRSGDGIANANLTVRKDGKDLKTVNSDEDGKFVIEGITPGTYNLVVNAAGYGSGVLYNVEVKKGHVRDLGQRLILNRDDGELVIIKGSVFFREGTSVTGAKIELERVNADGSTKRVASTYTTVSGEFTLRQPGEPAKFRITASYKGRTGMKEIQADNPAVYRTAITLDLSRTEK